MHVQMVIQMVTICSVGPIYKSDLWSFMSETPECCPRFISGDPFISGFPGLVQMIVWLSDQWIFGDDGDDDDVSFSSVYFGTLELDLWLHVPSDGCDRFRDQGCDSEQ